MDEAALRGHLTTAQAEIDKALRLLDEEPATVTVIKPGDNLLSILADAEAGAAFAIEPAFTADLGEWKLPKPVTLKSTVDPGPNRVGLGLAGPLLKGFLKGMAQHTVLSGLRFETTHANGTAITAGNNLTLDRCVVYGSPTGAHRGVAVNASDIRISRCHIGNIWKDQDTQAVGGWDGCKNILVEDCFLEASGENVMFGGATAASEDRIPQDIVITDCHLFKPMSWKGKAGCAVKNLYELKNAKRVTLRRSILENSWVHAQVGFAIVLSVRNQASGDGNPWSTIQDCVIEDCVTKNSAGGISVLGRDDSGESIVMKNMVIRNTQITNINPKVYGGNGRQLQIGGGPDGLAIEGCTFDGEGLSAAMNLTHEDWKITNFRYVGNRAHEGAYGVHGDGAPGLGKAALDFYMPGGYTWERNVIEDYSNRNISWPPGTTLVPLNSP